MIKIKSYTDLEQSKKLAEILPLESADLKWFFWMEESNASKSPSFGYSKTAAESYKDTDAIYLPCWSLASLLDALPEKYTELIKEGGMYRIIIKDSYMTSLFDNPIDACVVIIEYLHEHKYCDYGKERSNENIKRLL